MNIVSSNFAIHLINKLGTITFNRPYRRIFLKRLSL